MTRTERVTTQIKKSVTSYTDKRTNLPYTKIPNNPQNVTRIERVTTQIKKIIAHYTDKVTNKKQLTIQQYQKKTKKFHLPGVSFIRSEVKTLIKLNIQQNSRKSKLKDF